MDWGHIALLTAMYVALGAVLVIVLWPTEPTGQRFLIRWGIADPAPAQSLSAAAYLRLRRLLYVALFVLTPPAVAALFGVLGQSESEMGVFRLFTPFVVALLLAEAFAAVRQVRGVRVAVLARRGWRDLVPAWAIALLLGLAALALALAGLGLAAQPWADRVAASLPPNDANHFVSDEYRTEITHSTSWLALGGTLLCLLAVLGLVRFAVRRRAVADPQVDLVLRARTARVAVGIGLGWLGTMVTTAVNRLAFLDSLSVGPDPRSEPPAWLDSAHSATQFLVLLLIFVVAAGWIWVANPPRPRDPVAAE